VYNKATKDLILIPKPSLTSARGNTPTNIGELNNRGIEFKIGYNTVVRDDLKFNASLGYSRNKTKIIKLATDIPIIESGTRKIAGGTLVSFGAIKLQAC